MNRLAIPIVHDPVKDAIVDRGTQDQDDGLTHFFETCCTQPHFRTLCGRYVFLTRKVRHTNGKREGRPLCAVCEAIAKTPYFCRRCGQRFVLSS